jgi:cytochrome c biogenesis protein CcmG, thiol:disulfide interchange protein DsbE
MNSKRNRAGRTLRIAAILVLLPLVAFVAYVLVVNVVALGLPAGQPAPDFSGRDLQGNVVRLSELRGRPVMLTFWSPECFACREEVPSLQAIAADPSADVALVTVVSRMPTVEVQQYVDEHKLTFPVIVDEAGKIPGLYQVSGIPFTYFIRPDGTLERTVIGAGEPGALGANLQRWLSTCKIDTPCAVKG